jgi:hypothetical protein
MVECAERLLAEGGFVKAREVIAIVAGTRTRSGSTNFLRLHVMGEKEGERFFAPHEEAPVHEEPAAGINPKRPAPRPAKTPAKHK